MSRWNINLVSAYKSFDVGDHAPFIGEQFPRSWLLMRIAGSNRKNQPDVNGVNKPRYFMFSYKEKIYFGEMGVLLDRLGKNYPYAVDGPDQHGRPIKYIYGFSAPKGTLVPSLDWIQKNDKFFHGSLSENITYANEKVEKTPDYQSDLESIAQYPLFEERYEYRNNEWDRHAKIINTQNTFKGIFISDPETLRPGTHEMILEQIAKKEERNRTINAKQGSSSPSFNAPFGTFEGGLELGKSIFNFVRDNCNRRRNPVGDRIRKTKKFY